MPLTAFLTYGFAAPVFLVWWAMGRGPVEIEDLPRPILRYRNERSSYQFSNGDKGLGASFGPGSRPAGHAAFGVDGAPRVDPSRGVASDSLLHGRGAIP